MEIFELLAVVLWVGLVLYAIWNSRIVGTISRMFAKRANKKIEQVDEKIRSLDKEN